MDARSTRVAEAPQHADADRGGADDPDGGDQRVPPRRRRCETVAHALNWVTWLAFLVELVVMLAVVPDRRAWLRHHPLDLIIVVLTPPVLPAGLQSLRVLRLLRLLRLLRPRPALARGLLAARACTTRCCSRC